MRMLRLLHYRWSIVYRVGGNLPVVCPPYVRVKWNGVGGCWWLEKVLGALAVHPPVFDISDYTPIRRIDKRAGWLTDGLGWRIIGF